MREQAILHSGQEDDGKLEALGVVQGHEADLRALVQGVGIGDQGGVVLSNGDRMLPDPILIGRDADKVERLAKQFNVTRWSTDLDKALADRNDTIFFDAATTGFNPVSLTITGSPASAAYLAAC